MAPAATRDLLQPCCPASAPSSPSPSLSSLFRIDMHTHIMVRQIRALQMPVQLSREFPGATVASELLPFSLIRTVLADMI